MKIKQTVFGSGPEKRLFKALEGAWPAGVVLYPSLPFRSIIDLSGARITNVERRYLNGASVDYTACDRADGRPLVSVEFDAMGHGYSVDGKYVELYPTQTDPLRSEKLDLKLRLARGANYPLVVVSYDEAAPVTPEDDQLTVTHAIIGEILADRNASTRFQEMYAEQRSELELLPSAQANEDIEDLLLTVEVQESLEWNPLARLRWELALEADATGLVVSTLHEPLWDPRLPDAGIGPSMDVDAIEARWEAMKKAHKAGSRVSIERRELAPVVAEAWIRNIEVVLASSIAEDLAHVRAYRACLKSGTAS